MFIKLNMQDKKIFGHETENLSATGKNNPTVFPDLLKTMSGLYSNAQAVQQIKHIIHKKYENVKCI